MNEKKKTAGQSGADGNDEVRTKTIKIIAAIFICFVIIIIC